MGRQTGLRCCLTAGCSTCATWRCSIVMRPAYVGCGALPGGELHMVHATTGRTCAHAFLL